MLLPAMRPLGDTDEDQFLVAETPSETTIDVPPEFPLRRQLLWRNWSEHTLTNKFHSTRFGSPATLRALLTRPRPKV